jgi:hypothetical protein
LSVTLQNRRMEYDAGHTSKFSGLFRLKVSRARVFQSVVKTGGGATIGGAYVIIVKVASSES